MPSIALVLLTAFAAVPLSGQNATGCTTPRDACAFFDNYLAAFNRRDWNAFRVTLSDDITVMFDSRAQPQRRDGRAAVEELFLAVFPPPGTPQTQLPPPVQPDRLVAQDLGDVVVISFHIRAQDEITRRTVVLHRTRSGWRVVHIHGSSFDLRPR